MEQASEKKTRKRLKWYSHVMSASSSNDGSPTNLGELKLFDIISSRCTLIISADVPSTYSLKRKIRVGSEKCYITNASYL